MSRLEINKALFPRRSKFKNEPVVVDGIWFQSKREAARYSQLCLLQRAGYVVGEIRRQVPYVLEINRVKICGYVADFVYETQDGKTIVEDVKGFRTREYQLKSRLMLAIHGIAIQEV